MLWKYSGKYSVNTLEIFGKYMVITLGNTLENT